MPSVGVECDCVYIIRSTSVKYLLNCQHCSITPGNCYYALVFIDDILTNYWQMAHNRWLRRVEEQGASVYSYANLLRIQVSLFSIWSVRTLSHFWRLFSFIFQLRHSLRPPGKQSNLSSSQKEVSYFCTPFPQRHLPITCFNNHYFS